jgi:tRNA nucleotidyltransferase (CCA-adding enzyme)
MDSGLVLVGGAVRDLLLGRAGGDWDLATSLLPEEVLRRAKAAHLRAIPTGLQHGTVTVMVAHQPIEITTYRGDGPYLDGRHPVQVTLGVALEEDLARRDFTVNAMALPLEVVEDPDWEAQLIDPFGGRQDLDAQLLRAVGDPLQRFAEDGLRPLRACRFAAQLGFELEPATLAAIPHRLEVARKVSVERVFAEMTKLLRGQEPARGLRLLEQTGLLDLWLPELRPMVGCLQNRHHRLDVWEHTLATFAAEQTTHADLRWALLCHDVGKPAVRTLDEAGEGHFYGHEAVSARIAMDILTRLRAPNQLREKVQGLILLHGEHPTEDWSDAAYRRLLKRLMEAGVETQEWELMRKADQYGKGWADHDQTPYGQSGAQWWVDTGLEWARILARLEAARFPGMTTQELALDGRDLMALAGRPGGPWLGALQKHLLEAVLEEPSRNQAEELRRLSLDWLQRAE